MQFEKKWQIKLGFFVALVNATYITQILLLGKYAQPTYYQEKLDFLADWSQKYPDKHTSYPSLSLALRKYNNGGITALLSNYGYNRGFSKINEHCFEYFKSIYLREGTPSAETTWRITLGFSKQ